MAAKRCSTCAINYPSTSYHDIKCVVCGEWAEEINNVEPDDDWKDKVAALKEHHAEAEAEPLDIPKVDARVLTRADGLFVSAWDVFHGGLKKIPLKPHTLIQIGKQTFEIVEFLREPNREYLVRAFSTTLSDEDMERLVAG